MYSSSYFDQLLNHETWSHLFTLKGLHLILFLVYGYLYLLAYDENHTLIVVKLSDH